MSASTPTVAGTPAPLAITGRFRMTHGRAYIVIIVASLVIAALSVALPYTPSYDPWCWLVWGREILHGSLHLKGGASWKPLPVIFTTVFAIFGKAQPQLWLVIARAGFIATILFSGKLAARLTLDLASARMPEVRSMQLARVLPAGLAALIAMFTVTLAGQFFTDSALGYSEALATAGILLATERHMDGHYRQAFALGLIAALDRPEFWAFWGPYGLWLMWKDPGARVMVVALAVFTVLIWFVPQKVGGGSFTASVSRATQVRANSAANTACPFCTEMKAAWKLSIFRVKIASIAVGLGALLLLLGAWSKRLPRLTLSPVQRRGLAYTAVVCAFGYGWWLLVSLETQAGFSGNNRYLELGVAATDIAGGICFGAVAVGLFSLPRYWVAEDRQRLRPAAQLSLATAVLAAIFVALPNFVGSNYNSPATIHHVLNDQAKIRQDLVFLIKKAGGAKAVQSCGNGYVMVEGFQVPMTAWYLDERTLDVQDQPPLLTHAQGLQMHVPSRYDAPVPWPNTIMQARANGASSLLPPQQTIDYWTSKGAHFTVTQTSTITMYQDCRTYPGRANSSTAK